MQGILATVMIRRAMSILSAMVAAVGVCPAAIDGNGNSQSDVWEMIFNAAGLPATGDADHDGWTNAAESLAGTDPFDPTSHPRLTISSGGSGPVLTSEGRPGKRYQILSSTDLTTWVPHGSVVVGNGAALAWPFTTADGTRRFFRAVLSDADTDGDGVNDWEELAIGFDPARTRTDRYSQADQARITAALAAPSTITVSTYDGTCAERWPDPAVFVVRRGGGLRALSVNVAFGGTATPGGDYTTTTTGNTVAFAPGQREGFVSIHPVADVQAGEPDETVTLTVLSGTGYTVGGTVSATATITDPAGPSAKEAARFLLQATYGPDQDSAEDADQIPENVEEVMAMGIGPWIDDQLQRPIGHLLPMVQWQNEQPSSAQIYNDRKMNAWWGRAMGLPKLRPDAATDQLPDPLRQRVGFALSQIFVVSDRMERLANENEGVTHFYDTLLQHAFGNYRDLLRAVSLHPAMGIYLSHLGNRRSDPVARTFPDENYAREIMQLFSIGLWMLNPDGTRQLDGNGQPIPTYGNPDITEFAKVFTGLSYGLHVNGSTPGFAIYDGDFKVPMKGWDAEHDLGPKTLLRGATTPARTATPGNTGTATMADVDAAIDNLFHHPNVGPFIGRLLIQRLVTSNPSSAYVGRVTAAFDAAPRGDLGRTVKAILMDPEARDPSMMSDPAFGKLREPFLRSVNVARAFNASSQAGWYYLDAFILDHAQEPMKAPSVFNFYLHTYTPPGALAEAGLVSPEMQIINASSGVTAPNYYWTAITGGLHRWGVGVAARTTRLNLDQEMLLNVPASAVNNPDPSVQPLDPDPLIRRLDLVLTGGTLAPESCQIIREALLRIGPGSGWDWPKNRLKLAIHLIVCSPEFAIQH